MRVPCGASTKRQVHFTLPSPAKHTAYKCLINYNNYRLSRQIIRSEPARTAGRSRDQAYISLVGVCVALLCTAHSCVKCCRSGRGNISPRGLSNNITSLFFSRFLPRTTAVFVGWLCIHSRGDDTFNARIFFTYGASKRWCPKKNKIHHCEPIGHKTNI